MLTRIGLKNFKCFQSLSLPLAPLTLLTGFNAAGKSTTLQVLLLLAQSLRSGNQSLELPLNGALARLGTPGEIMNSGNGEVHFSVENDQASIEWELRAEERTKGISMGISRIKLKSTGGSEDYEGFKTLVKLLPPGVKFDVLQLVETLREIIFLSAVRSGTSDVFPSPEEPSPVHVLPPVKV